MVLWISRGKCRVGLWRGIIIIRKIASTFHNGLAEYAEMVAAANDKDGDNLF